MKGIVFTEFFEMVEEQFGFEIIEQLLQQTSLATGGAYTSVGTYDHKELIELIGNLSKLTSISVNDLLEAYGQNLFTKLINLTPDLIKQFTGSIELLSAVDDIIHVEVKKLYPDAELPKFSIVKQVDNELQMTYTSARPFVYLAKGLIEGCGKHFGDDLNLSIENSTENSLFIIKRNNDG